MYTFKPDYFSNKINAPSKLDEESSIEYKNILKKYYPNFINKETKFYFFGELGINSSNILLKNNFGNHVLKKSKKSNKKFHYDSCKISLKLNELNQKIPLILHNYNSELISASESNIYSLWEYSSGDYFSGENREIENVALAINQFFNTLRKIPSGRNIKESNPDLNNIYLVYKKFLNSKNFWNKFLEVEQVNYLLTNIGVYENVLSLLKKKNEYTFLNHDLTHFDLHPHNIIMKDSEVVSFLDLDSICYYPRSVASGFAAFKLYRQYMSLDLNNLRNINTSFRDFCKIINPEESFENLIFGATAEIMRRTCFILEPILNGKSSPWSSVLWIQLVAIHEISLLETM